jgi:hypothetical protein
MKKSRQDCWKSAFRGGVAALLVLAALAAGCSRPASPPTDSKSLKEHAEELKKQHQREIKNK